MTVNNNFRIPNKETLHYFNIVCLDKRGKRCLKVSKRNKKGLFFLPYETEKTKPQEDTQNSQSITQGERIGTNKFMFKTPKHGKTKEYPSESTPIMSFLQKAWKLLLRETKEFIALVVEVDFKHYAKTRNQGIVRSYHRKLVSEPASSDKLYKKRERIEWLFGEAKQALGSYENTSSFILLYFLFSRSLYFSSL